MSKWEIQCRVTPSCVISVYVKLVGGIEGPEKTEKDNDKYLLDYDMIKLTFILV